MLPLDALGALIVVFTGMPDDWIIEKMQKSMKQLQLESFSSISEESA
jgi:hypothetical protein